MDFESNFSATINGKAAKVSSAMAVVNPATAEPFAEAPNCGKPELDAAVDAARAAFPSWSRTPLADRQRMVAALGEVLLKHKAELGALLTKEQGKPLAEGIGEVMGGAHWCRTFAKMDIPVTTVEDNEDRRVEIRRTPLGVVAALAPWNFPIILAMLKVAPALVAGNTVVLKPSPFTPLSTLKIGEIARSIMPAGVLNVISGGDSLGPLMTTHPDVDKITFTGSTATGRKIMANAAETLKRITLELGGNDAAIIMPDVDVALVSRQIFNSAFGNTGQVCVAAKRLYVHEDIYEEFAEALAALVRKAKIGDGLAEGTRFGPIQNKQHFERLNALIEDCREAGCRIRAQSESVPEGPGYFMPLTLLDDVPDDAAIVREEQFGPILPMIKFRDIGDLMNRVNDTPYGLGSQLWTSDLDVADDLSAQLNVGNVWINQIQAMYPNAPFGGHKASGIGVESSLEGLLAFTNAQTVALRKRSVCAGQAG